MSKHEPQNDLERAAQNVVEAYFAYREAPPLESEPEYDFLKAALDHLASFFTDDTPRAS